MVVYERYSLGFPGSGYETMPDLLEGLWTTDDWHIFLNEVVRIEEERVAQDSRNYCGGAGLGALLGSVIGLILKNQFNLRFWIVALLGFVGVVVGYFFVTNIGDCSDKIWKDHLEDYCADIEASTMGLKCDIRVIDEEGKAVPDDLKGSGLDQDLLYTITLVVEREHPRELDSEDSYEGEEEGQTLRLSGYTLSKIVEGDGAEESESGRVQSDEEEGSEISA